MADRLDIYLPGDVLLEQWQAEFELGYREWLVIIAKIEECHKRNAEIPWSTLKANIMTLQ